MQEKLSKGPVVWNKPGIRRLRKVMALGATGWISEPRAVKPTRDYLLMRLGLQMGTCDSSIVILGRVAAVAASGRL